MDLQLKGKTALITGSTEGIGFATAVGLAREGVFVYLNGREETKLQHAIERLKEKVPNGQAQGIVADFGKVQEINRLIQKLPQVDILINNVGIYGDLPFETTSDQDWFYYYEVNVLSGVRLSRHYVDYMKKQNWGRIIFLSSESAINIPEDMILYGVTKTSCLALSRGLAKHLRGTNVTVNAILPGPTWAAGNHRSMQAVAAKNNISEEEAAQLFLKEKRPSTIIERFANPEEVANLIVYVASPLSSATTGAALRVDGGVVDTAF